MDRRRVAAKRAAKEELLNEIDKLPTLTDRGLREIFKYQLEKLTSEFHDLAEGHGPENFRSCTHAVCESIKKAIRNL